MHVASHDQGYVEVPAPLAYAALTDLQVYPRWWPDARWRGGLVLDLGGFKPLQAHADRFRENLGLVLTLEGRAPGTLEWHLVPLEDGTIVNAILNMEGPGGRRRSARRLLRARIRIHRGLVGLKHDLEAAA